MNKTFFKVLLVAATLSACSQDDDNAPEETRLMRVEIVETPMVSEQANASQRVSRGTVFTGSSLSDFSMNYQNSKYDFTKKNGTWSTNNTWPGVSNDTKINFYAYNGGTFEWNSGTPYVSYTCESEAPYLKDLLVATNNVSFNDHKGIVPLTFNHACAAVNFYIKKKDGISNTFNVNSVILSGVKNQGHYNYSTSSTSAWSALSGSASYTLNDATMSNIPVTPATSFSCGTLFLIPQSKSGLKVTIKYTVDGGSEKEKTFTLSGDWAAGTSYSVTIQMGSSFV